VLQEIENLSQKYGYRIANVFHAGDGNLHPVLYDNSVPGALEQVEELERILKLCVQVVAAFLEASVQMRAICRTCLLSDLETMQWVRGV